MEVTVIRAGLRGIVRETMEMPADVFAVPEAPPDAEAERDLLLADHEMRLLLLENS